MSDIAILREQISRKCALQCGWKSREQLWSYLRTSAESYRERDYLTYLQESEYCDGIAQLANGLAFVVRTVGEKPEAVHVLESVAVFWRSWGEQMSGDELLPHLRRAWLEAVAIFDGTVAWCCDMADRPRLGIYYQDVACLDWAWNYLVERRLDPNDREFSLLLDQWLQSRAEMRSATVVDFLCRVRVAPNELTIYRHPAVLAAAFDKRQCKAHLDAARAYLEARSGVGVVDLAADLLT